jgi:hypothetical protein
MHMRRKGYAVWPLLQGGCRMNTRTLRLLPSLLAMLRAFPAALEVLYLQWALREIDPLHPDVPFIVARIRQLESKA